MMVPMISSLAALWLARVPAAYLLAHFFGPMNIHFCYAIGWALGLAICVPYYFSGRWKEKSIVVRAAGRKLNTKKRLERDLQKSCSGRAFLLLLFSTVCPDKRRLNARLHQKPVFFGTAVCVAVRLAFAVGAKPRQIKCGKINSFLFIRLQDTGIPRALQFGKICYAVKSAGAAVAIRNRCRIIAGGDPPACFQKAFPAAGKGG